MHIEHIAIWTQDLESMKEFYVRYFKARPNDKYTNSAKGFESYFLSFESGARLELMRQTKTGRGAKDASPGNIGLAHFALSTGSREAVIDLTSRIEKDGFTVASQPRLTGDGYFESCILDPEGNRVEITG